MNRNTLIITVGAVWLVSLAAVWHLGKQSTAADSADPSRPGGITSSSPSGSAVTSSGGKRGPTVRGSTENGKPLTVKQIIARTAAAMRGGAMMNPMSMVKAMAWLDDISPADLPAALAEVDALTDPQQKMMLQMALLGKWAETDGPAAMKYAEEHPAGSGMMAQMGKMGVAAAWAEKDPEAVWKWYKEQNETDSGGGPFGGSMVLVSLFSQLAANDPAQAFKRLEELEDTERQMALGGVLQASMFDDAKRTAILKELEAMPDADERKQAKQMMLSQWAMLAPDQAMEWVKTQPPAEQDAMRETAGTMLLMSDPKKGASFLLDGATDEQKPQRYDQIITTWAMTDTNAAGTWLSAQPQGPHLDAARSSFVTAASRKDPESAMAWAATITDVEKRIAATGKAYHAWDKKDPAAAATALNNSGLSAEQIQTVGESPATSDASPTPPIQKVPAGR